MRFEEQVNHLLVRYPELRVYGPQPKTPRAFHAQIDEGVARGRRLHGKFVREAAKTLVVEPLTAVLARIASEYAYRTTVRALRQLEDHRLDDIGVERGDIRAVARAVANGEPRPKARPTPKSAPRVTADAYEVAKAA